LHHHIRNMSLCPSCRRFDIQFLSLAPYPWRNIPSEAVLRSAEDGCTFCCLLVASLGEGFRKKMIGSSWVRIYFETLRETPSGETGTIKRDSPLRVRWLWVALCSTLRSSPMAERDPDFILHVAADEGMFGTLCYSAILAVLSNFRYCLGTPCGNFRGYTRSICGGVSPVELHTDDQGLVAQL